MQVSVNRIDPNIPDKTVINFGENENEPSSTFEMSYKPLSLEGTSDGVSLAVIDKPSGVLRVWSSMVESLTFTAIVAIEKYQSQALDMLFVVLRDLLTVPGKLNV